MVYLQVLDISFFFFCVANILVSARVLKDVNLGPGLESSVFKRDLSTAQKDLTPHHVEQIHYLVSGGLGIVFTGEWNGKKVAIKSIKDKPKPENSKSLKYNPARLNEQLKAEGELQIKTREDKGHQYSGIVGVEDIIDVEGRTYLIEDRWDESLYDASLQGKFTTMHFIKPMEEKKKTVPVDMRKLIEKEKEVKIAFDSIVRAVDFMHETKKTQHLDLKPSNIVVRTINGKPEFALSDFGCATKDMELDTPRGTKLFMAPEAYYSVFYKPRKKYSTQRADLWSLAVTLLVLLVGGIKNAKGQIERSCLHEFVNNSEKTWKIRYPFFSNAMCELLEIMFQSAERRDESAIEWGARFWETEIFDSTAFKHFYSKPPVDPDDEGPRKKKQKTGSS